MDGLLAEFSLLSGEALRDKGFDPSRIESLMELFEQEAQKSLAQMDAEAEREAREAEAAMREAEVYLSSLMEASEEEVRVFEKEAKQRSESELQSLVKEARTVKKVGEFMGKAATAYSKKYMDAALLSATASMKSSWSGLVMASSRSKVHPS